MWGFQALRFGVVSNEKCNNLKALVQYGDLNILKPSMRPLTPPFWSLCPLFFSKQNINCCKIPGGSAKKKTEKTFLKSTSVHPPCTKACVKPDAGASPMILGTSRKHRPKAVRAAPERITAQRFPGFLANYGNFMEFP